MKEFLLGGSLALLLCSVLLFAILKENELRERQVYKVEYFDLNNDKQIVYSENVSTNEGSVTFKLMNSDQYKTIGGRFEITNFKKMTLKEMKEYKFPSNK
ncbi:hypothetical protein [Bacillus cereus]|uniref:hypothetical protein n=1 Tax=Bacillus cereus TaxID=1396 RepID=UPI000B4AB72F|nr:hypothetical protein [Bacillus cereus]